MWKRIATVERSGGRFLASIGPKGILFHLEPDGWVGGVLPVLCIHKFCPAYKPWEDVPESEWTDRIRAMIRRVEVEDVPEPLRGVLELEG